MKTHRRQNSGVLEGVAIDSAGGNKIDLRARVTNVAVDTRNRAPRMGDMLEESRDRCSV